MPCGFCLKGKLMNVKRALVLTIHAFLLAGFAGNAFGQLSATSVYVPITPCRIVDTRVTGGPFAAKQTRTYSTNGAATQGGGACTVYSGEIPTALSVNVTVDATSLGSPTQYGYLSLSPTPGAASSWMNFFGGQTVANAGVATINPNDGSFAIKTQNPANVVVDVYGYWVYSSIQLGTFGAPDAIRIGQAYLASGSQSIAIGTDATTSGENAVALGYNTAASGFRSIALGDGTVSSGQDAMSMGFANTASGASSTVMGNNNIASGDISTAMGQFSDTNNHLRAFVYGDGSANTTNDADDQFMARASGGFKLLSSAGATAGVSLAAGASAWTVLSDRNAKDLVQPLDSTDVLDRVIAMPLATWHYKAQDPQYRHMGPMAQDFYAAFHLGESDTGIDTVDADGVTLAAIQGLNAKLMAQLGDRDREIANLRSRVASLESLSARVAALEHAQTANEEPVALAPK